jgi:hypothetical protein
VPFGSVAPSVYNRTSFLPKYSLNIGFPGNTSLIAMKPKSPQNICVYTNMDSTISKTKENMDICLLIIDFPFLFKERITSFESVFHFKFSIIYRETINF